MAQQNQLLMFLFHMVSFVVSLNQIISRVGLLLFGSSVIVANVVAGERCTVIAHRGASGYFPEHTLEAYQLAMEQGADYIEPDLVLTSDGVAIARHEARLELTTDVADRPEFAPRRSVRVLRDEEVSGWFSDDFTLEEIKTLRARERFPDERPANTQWNDRFTIPTLTEIIALVRAYADQTDVQIGIYPELKSPAYFAEQDLDITATVLEELAVNGMAQPPAKVIIQSFDESALRRARSMTSLPLVRLLGSQEPADIARETSAAALAEIAEYADGIGVYKYGYVLAEDATSKPLPFRDTGMVQAAHAAGLYVHVYTFRAENRFLPEAFREPGTDAMPGRLKDELAAFIATGIDGIFIDQPDIGSTACKNRQ